MEKNVISGISLNGSNHWHNPTFYFEEHSFGGWHAGVKKQDSKINCVEKDILKERGEDGMEIELIH